MEGQGFYNMVNGGTYSGMWENNKFHGKGIQQTPDGRKYDGDFAEGVKHGHGLYTWRNGK